MIRPLNFFASSSVPCSSEEAQTNEATLSFIEVTVSGKAFSVAYTNNTLRGPYHIEKGCLSAIARTQKQNRITMDGLGSSASRFPEHTH